MSDVERAARQVRAPIGAFFLILTLTAVCGALLWRGYEFYILDLDARLDHPDFRVLSPGEIVGHGYGIVGTGLIFTNLLYLVRRKLARWPLGSMRFWLDLHVVTGLVGSALIVFHSAFQLRTPIAVVTSVSLFVVVFTGIVGRYLYAIAPSVDTTELEKSIEALDGLVPQLGLRARQTLAAHPVTDPGATVGLIRTIFTLPRWFSEMRTRRKRVRALAGELDKTIPPGEVQLIKRGLKRTASLGAGEVRAVAASTLLRTWRSLHRILAVAMLLSVSVHIGVAWFYGYRWIFSDG
ncbi:MAG: hypothetical protein AB7S26_02270 [Sandaracinaceae bacterium]